MITEDSHTSEENQIKITLNLSESEIEIIRYTWNKMFLEDEGIATRPLIRCTSRDFPGGYPEEGANPVQDVSSTTSSIAQMLEAKRLATVTGVFCYQVYQNLSARYPGLEKMFPSLKHQATHFATVLRITVTQLEDLSQLDDYLCRLGKRHSRILKVEPLPYELMGEALIETFQQRFGTKFNQDFETAWTKLYLFLANSILQFGVDPVMTCEGPLHNNRVYTQPTSTDDESSSQESISFKENMEPSPTIDLEEIIPERGRKSPYDLYKRPTIKYSRSSMAAMATAAIKRKYRKI
ncbi:uncharacterized protein SPAPADRAFT_64181 [Spathaspora passalidarum NRRL Y-27907]|uniref:Globin domain-containing protein n=1 Tax=Spathaspora passalidarum (strain NRRL Y-27907 / 11-Y1) TaxID=619300 RepID=G3AFJ0_SPAPN|nr:uncharacterized protein SPAPADRAFT_64181 [Spathaspora passalidarum NRRL Y-27907]EGW34979.1 hypothetical protein SPAPADRAFT_64181 [Spathaspora passalidarum NRRL Y-27907]